MDYSKLVTAYLAWMSMCLALLPANGKIIVANSNVMIFVYILIPPMGGVFTQCDAPEIATLISVYYIIYAKPYVWAL